jgi:hypothetical protein
MRSFRQRLAWIVSVWLVCQAGVLAAAPLSLAGVFPNAEAEGLLCTCAAATGPDHYCPMHGRHQGHPDAESNSEDCVLRSGVPASDVMLASLIGGVGLVPPVYAAAETIAPIESIVTASADVLVRPAHPESPPPKPSVRTIDLS